jgi:outer membrane protein OmpA-like peptidoglycan-associated protein
MSLASTLEEMMTPELVGSLAARSGLPDTKTKKGITGATATVLDGLVNKAHDTTTMTRVADLVSKTPDEVDAGTLLDDNAPLHKNGTALLGVITRDSTGMASKLAKGLGVGTTTAASLLATAASLAIGALHKLGGFNPSTLASTLLGEKQSIHAAVPTGFTTTEARRDSLPTVRERNRSWWPIVLIALVAFGVWMWSRSRDRHEAPAPAPTRHQPSTREPSQTPVTPHAQLGFPVGSVEAQFLDQVHSPTGHAQTITLDKVEFDPSSANLRSEANRQLAGIAQILQANPDVKVEVAGSADATGTPEHDQKLAQARAESVRQALVTDGVDANRITAAERADQAKGHTTIRVTSR